MTDTEQTMQAEERQRPAEAEQGEHSKAPPHSQSGDGPDAAAKAAKTDDKAQEKTSAHQNNIVHGDVEANTINYTTNFTEIKNVLNEEQKFSVRPFTPGMGQDINHDKEEEAATDLLIDDAFLRGLLDRLLQHRFIVLQGTLQSGKSTVAMALAHHLRQKRKRQAAATLLIPPLGPGIHIDLADLPDDGKLKGRTIIFINVLAKLNKDLREAIGTLDEACMDSLTAKLDKADMYLLLTADSHTLSSLPIAARNLPIYATLPPPGERLLRQAWQRAIQAARLQGTSDLEDDVVKRAKSISTVFRFVRDYLPRVLTKELDIGEAFHRIGNVEHWLLHHVSDEFEAWMSAVVLGLCHCPPSVNGIPWAEFERFRELLAPAILAKVGKPAQEEHYKKNRVSDEWLLSQIHAVVERDAQTRRDTLRFSDDMYGDRVWATLIRHCRGLLVSLFTALVSMLKSDELFQRMIAGRCLGRIGEIDPDALVRPLLEDCQRSNMRTQAAAGYVFQGILASTDPQYRAYMLDWLAERVDRTDKNANWTAIAIYQRIGHVDLALSLAGLRNVAERHLVTMFTDFVAGERHIVKLNNYAKQLDMAGEDGTGLKTIADIMREFLSDVFAEELEMLFGLQYALASLCIVIDPIRLFDELRGWMKGNDSLAALTTLLFLQPAGIADELIAHAVRFGVGAEGFGKSVTTNPVTIALSAGNEQARQILAEFFDDVFSSFYSFFPTHWRSKLTEWYFHHIKQMAKNSLLLPQAREGMEIVFQGLLNSMNGDLKSACIQFLAASDRTSLGDEEFREFVQAVRRRDLAPKHGLTTAGCPPEPKWV